MISESTGERVLLARAHSAVAIQLGGIITLFLGCLPYFLVRGKGMEDWVLYMLGGFPVLAIVVAVTIFRACRLHLIWQSGDTVPLNNIAVDASINAMALVNLFLLFALIILTGGITNSPFVSLLLLLPVLAILLKASLMATIVSVSNILFVALVLLEIPAIVGYIASLLGPYHWLLSFAGNSVGIAYEISIIINLSVTVWSTYVQYSVLSKATVSNRGADGVNTR